MIERSSCARFLLEAPQPIGIGREFLRQQLHGDVGIEPGVVRAIPHGFSEDGSL